MRLPIALGRLILQGHFLGVVLFSDCRTDQSLLELLWYLFHSLGVSLHLELCVGYEGYSGCWVTFPPH